MLIESILLNITSHNQIPSLLHQKQPLNSGQFSFALMNNRMASSDDYQRNDNQYGFCKKDRVVEVEVLKWGATVWGQHQSTEHVRVVRHVNYLRSKSQWSTKVGISLGNDHWNVGVVGNKVPKCACQILMYFEVSTRQWSLILLKRLFHLLNCFIELSITGGNVLREWTGGKVGAKDDYFTKLLQTDYGEEKVKTVSGNDKSV